MKLLKRGVGGAAVLVALIAVLASCDTGGNMIPGLTEGYGAVTLQIQGTLTASGGPVASVVAARAAGDPLIVPVADTAGVEIGTLTLTDARINLSEIELEQDDDEVDTEEESEQELEIEFEGPFVVDFIGQTVTPELPMIEMLPGTYDNIELKLDKVEADDTDPDGNPLVSEDDPLFGNSIYLAGTYSGESDGGTLTNVPFSLELDLDEEFELSTGAATQIGLIVEDGQLNPVVIAFRIAQWFAFDNPETNSDLLIDFSDVVAGTGSTITLDASATGANDTIRDIIKDNIKKSADFGEDEDGSGELESDEDDDPDDEDDDDFIGDDDSADDESEDD